MYYNNVALLQFAITYQSSNYNNDNDSHRRCPRGGQSTLSVHFPSYDDASLVTSIHTRPYTPIQDISLLYYTASDIAEFKADSKRYKRTRRMSRGGECYHDDDDDEFVLDLIESNIEEEEDDDSMEKNDVPHLLADDPNDENDASLNKHANADETIISRDDSSTNNTIWMTLYDLAMDMVTSVVDDDECEGEVEG